MAGGRVGYGLRSVLRHSLATLLATTALGVVAAHAVDGTWTGGSTDWTDPTNWTSNPSVPDGTATFTNTGSAAVDNNNGVVSIGTIQFAGTSQAYTFTIGNPFIVNATGIVNNDTVNIQTFQVTSGNNLVFQNSSTANGGAGAVTITNDVGGNVNFIQNSTAGTASLINSGLVTFAASSSAGSAQITTNNGGSTKFAGSSSGGSAKFITNAGGTVDISGLTSGGTTAGSIEGAGNYVLGGNTLTTGSLNTSTQVDGVISGGGGLTKVGTGTLTLAGTNTYTGATTIAAGTLAISGFGSISSSSVVTVDATFDISGAAVPFNVITALAGSSSGVVNMGGNGLVMTNASTEFAGVIQGTGGLEVFGGTQTLSGVNTYSNATQIDAGATLALKGAGSIADSAFVSFSAANATLDISQTTSGTSVRGLGSPAGSGIVALGSRTLTITSGSTFGGVIQDDGIGGGTGGSVVIANGATQSLSGTNTYTGATTIAAGGELDLASSGGSIAASSGVVANGVFDISNLTNGGTSITSLTGSGNVHLGNNTLTITAGNGTFSGVIDDTGFPGGLTITGGRQTLTGANTYVGNTNVNGGTLVVDGVLFASAAFVNAGGTLAGTGTLSGIDVNGGTLAPGNAANPYGTLSVSGNVTFTAASTYLVQVSSASASLTQANGTGDLGGATVRANFGTGTLKKQYAIFYAAGGLVGTTFNPTVVSNMPTVNATLSYDALTAYLNIGLNFTPAGGLNVNQQNVANTLTNFFNTTGGIPAAFAALTPAGLTTASGELGTGIIQSAINADGQFLNLMLDPTVVGRSGGFAKAGSVAQFAESDNAASYASMRPATAREREAYAMATKAPLFSSQPSSRWSVWTAGYGGSAEVGGNATVGSQDLTARVWGGAAGADYRLSVDTLVGFALGGGGLNYSLANAMGSGSADLFQAGVYGRHNFGPAYVSAALAYGWRDVTTNRTVAPGGFDQLQGRFKADTFSARFEGGYRFTTPLIGITPYAAAQVTNFNLPNYSEVSLNGGGLFALNYASQSLTDTRSELGLRTDKSYAMQNGVLTLRGRAAWAHDYNPGRAVTALFQTLPGTSFLVNGARVDADSALVSASADMKWLSGFSIAGTFDGEFSGNVTSYSGKGVFKYSW
ncbi:autotransporter outer membrane beta-barrel domain-containing protein [Bradyrhizobium ottawaense]|nr:autotransporter outer membrane beta-barrel domain-containing protein [Bradyrhizobium sp. TM233]GMO63644.1 autotransporter outer membrane beta-barrel domain-containing protein [Bradyrhizobium ottawaense]GMO94776.1 autotransporter outer membrane beta-barrel domain-containing protein [Bradyrhizobium ottawaense]GMP05946.1 autotransporter outer membrane beta-barrel domain-containing protein [Bradyrhizobium ottawaense]GMP16561.1 autotransporter outer membrane beta-barrel domain-containing protein 